MSKPQSLESARVMDDAALRREMFTPDLRGLIAWLETQEPEKRYDYDSTCSCVAAQFLTRIGQRTADGHFNGMFLPDLFGGVFHLYTYHQVCATEPWTFAAALDRARSALTSAAFQEGEGK